MINDIADAAPWGLDAALAVAAALIGRRLARTKRQLREQSATATSQIQSRDAALAELNDTRLPAIVHAISQGEPLPPGRPPLDDFTKHLRTAEEQVVRALAEARDRAGQVSQGTLLAVTRTLQSLVNGQQVAVTDMINRHDSPEVVADLMVFDHTTGQVLRRTQSLAVACGAWPGKQHDPTPAFDVVRGALGRILDYRRVQITQPESNRAVIGRSVEGLVIALAELLENATRYSHPDTVVQVQFQQAHNGLSIVIDDAGVSLPPGARERARHFLSGEHPIDVTRLGDPPKIGFPVIGALARRYGFTASVDTPSPYGGVRAVVYLPSATLTDAVPQPPRTAAAAPPAPPNDQVAAAPVGSTAHGLPKRRRHAPTEAPAAAEPSARIRTPEQAAAPFDAFLRGTQAGRGQSHSTDEGNTLA
ncbi:ATP-binding protein [Streptomyces finlayi]|uniref:histidine kinase n=1 Tax=Streptomyces finlayi TaxID=67296 RepID=A0A7G7BGJ1_9ACTN|nr:ATP-binding protein [Streptomyces finlayi]QNE74456.1 ATP-binding protein [Streptomyces finlayi]